MSLFTGNYPQLMAEYNRWMNGKIYAACADLPDAERRTFLGFRRANGRVGNPICSSITATALVGDAQRAPSRQRGRKRKVLGGPTALQTSHQSVVINAAADTAPPSTARVAASI